MKGLLPLPEKAPSASQALTVVTLFPAGGLLLVLSGLALAASVVGVVVAAPVFLLFSPCSSRPPSSSPRRRRLPRLRRPGPRRAVLPLLARRHPPRHVPEDPDYVDQAKRRMADAARTPASAPRTPARPSRPRRTSLPARLSQSVSQSVCLSVSRVWLCNSDK
uniref:Oleosin n=1 Tax=Ananas comosus var. bracteatus TaxID=296719 RepID=A0A6V7PNU8_ANACO|nr:unnamed protein product [Ananas comosus var. bracteatus]